MVRCPPARGFTLVELVVALALGGVAFGAFALVVAQQERVHGELTRRVRARAQLAEGLAALVADLRAISPAAGDIAVGGAQDSSIQFRSAVGTGVVCEARDRSVVIGYASFVTPPTPGDTAWAYVARGDDAAWVPLAIGGVSTFGESEVAPCPFPTTAASILAPRTPHARYALTLTEPVADPIGVGAPLRVIRVVRYSLYRAPDGRWYLGRREWSPSQGRFETIQPVSGPYRSYAAPAAGMSGLELRYLDGDGVELPSGSSATNRIAQVAITLRAAASHSGDGTREQRDAASLSVAFRNRP